jgi:hypothetical protein
MSSAFAMRSVRRGLVIAPQPSTPPPPAERSSEDNDHSVDNVIEEAMDVNFMADAKQEVEEERAAFDAEQEHCREAVTAEDASGGSSDIKWDYDGQRSRGL